MEPGEQQSQMEGWKDLCGGEVSQSWDSGPHLLWELCTTHGVAQVADGSLLWLWQCLLWWAVAGSSLHDVQDGRGAWGCQDPAEVYGHPEQGQGGI